MGRALALAAGGTRIGEKARPDDSALHRIHLSASRAARNFATCLREAHRRYAAGKRKSRRRRVTRNLHAAFICRGASRRRVLQQGMRKIVGISLIGEARGTATPNAADRGSGGASTGADSASATLGERWRCEPA